MFIPAACPDVDRAWELAKLLYFNGKLDESISRMQKLQDSKRMRRHRVMLNGVYNKLTYIKGQYNAGTGFLQAGKLREAQDAMDKALAHLCHTESACGFLFQEAHVYLVFGEFPRQGRPRNPAAYNGYLFIL